MHAQNVLRGVLVCLLMVAVIWPASAQYGNTKRKKKRSKSPARTESVAFAERVWFGANLNDISFFNQTFSIGATPMAAIEVNPVVSMGAMIKLSYRYENLSSAPPKITFETFDYGPGVFARAHFLGSYFAQIEYERGFFQVPVYNGFGLPVIEDNKVQKNSIAQDYVYIGLGYMSTGGGNVQMTAAIHYNVLDDIDYVRIPWDFRIGIRWNLVPPSKRL